MLDYLVKTYKAVKRCVTGNSPRSEQASKLEKRLKITNDYDIKKTVVVSVFELASKSYKNNNKEIPKLIKNKLRNAEIALEELIGMNTPAHLSYIWTTTNNNQKRVMAMAASMLSSQEWVSIDEIQNNLEENYNITLSKSEIGDSLELLTNDYLIFKKKEAEDKKASAKRWNKIYARSSHKKPS